MKLSRARSHLTILAAAVALMLMSTVPAWAGWQVPILPDRGMYYTPGHGGTGLTVDVDPNGFVFAAFYGYGDDGAPVYYLMSGLFKPADDIMQSSDPAKRRSEIGTFDGDIYTTRDGECLGEDCGYQRPENVVTGKKAHIVWITSRHARLTIGSQSWDLWAGQYTHADTDKITGSWTATVTTSFPPGSNMKSHVAMLKIRKSDYPGTVLGSGGADYKIYEVACAGATDEQWDLQTTCPEFYAALRGFDSGGSKPRYWLLYNTADGTLQLAPYDVVDGQPQFRTSTSGSLYQMELTPGVMRGRQIVFDDTGIYETHTGTLDMIRVPNGTVDAAPE